MSACPSCGAACPATAKFCPACGHVLDAAAAPTMTSPATRLPIGSPPGDHVRSHAAHAGSFDHGRFSPGTMLAGRYRIVGRLGAGGMGEVYRADDLTIGQAVALKFLPEAYERDGERLDRLMGELRTARQVSHPNVCRVYDVGDVDGRRFLTMEYVDGEDLRSLLQRIGRLPEDKGLDIARQICAGLAAIHDRAVLHRDLKPANIMLDGRGRVRLTDFGLATAAAGAGTDGAIAGTPAYMAPEQRAGQPLSPATDLYALGLVLFELFTGERTRIDDLRDPRATAAPPATGSGSKLDPIVQRVIERCLDADPRRRPQSAVIVAAALPGGDPLAAALAAGETPSPQMVAAAGPDGGLSFAVAVPLLVAVILGVAVTAWLERRHSYSSHVSAPHSAEVLSSKAREVLTRLGYTEPVADSASRFVRNDDYFVWVDERDRTPTRWQHLASVRPPVARFWYRSSPRAMNPVTGSARGGGLAVSRVDPPMTIPGMTYVELDPDGRLVALDVVAADRIDAAAAVAVPDWAALFREAGLDPDRFTAATPEWVSRSASDAAAAWTGPGADAGGAELRVEAAAFRGRPVFFRLIAPWTRPVNVQASSSPGTVERIGGIFIGLIILGVPLAAVALSLRNVRFGRTDARGAARLALAFGCVTLMVAALGTHWTGDLAWLTNMLPRLVSWAAFMALFAWTLYAALEPYARRRWPQMLVSWSRLVDGRWRDALIGRDFLAGSALALAMALVTALGAAIGEWRGAPPPMPNPSPSLTIWMGPLTGAANLIGVALESIGVALGVVMLLVTLRLILRSERAATIGLAVVLTAPTMLGSGEIVSSVFAVLRIATWAIIATRFGLVMFAVFLVVTQMTGYFSAPDFAAGSVALAMGTVLAIGVFGFYTATRGRKASAWLDG